MTPIQRRARALLDWSFGEASMVKRRLLRDVPVERSPIPLVVAIVGLVAAVASSWITNEDLGADLFGCGLITASYCALYWLISPRERVD